MGKLKSKLIEATELAFPDYTRPFILYVDGNGTGLGTGLQQEQPDGSVRPVLFSSRRLSPAETRYHSTELETLGLVWALQKLVHYLDDSMIHVITDHPAIHDAFQNYKLYRGSNRFIT